MVRRARDNAGNTAQLREITVLFRQHLQDHHHIETEKEFEPGFVKEHLEGKHILIPVSIFSNNRLSALETIVKYLRENEQLRNNETAQMLGKAPTSVWITYRNACRKLASRFHVGTTDVFIPTSEVSSYNLSVLESISLYLKLICGFSYRKIGRLLNRDERTIWTVCSRARKKLAK
jgi:DNA-binding CsgD family transcriptional regulator